MVAVLSFQVSGGRDSGKNPWLPAPLGQPVAWYVQNAPPGGVIQACLNMVSKVLRPMDIRAADVPRKAEGA